MGVADIPPGWTDQLAREAQPASRKGNTASGND